MNKYKLGPWLVFLAALLWAADAPFRKFLTETLSSTSIVFMGHIFIVILVLPFLLAGWKEIKQLDKKSWLAVMFIALGGEVLGTVFFTESFRHVNPSVAILLQKVQPLIAILLAWFILKEALGKRFWFWAFIGIVGAYLLTFPEIRPAGLSIEGGTLGVVFALLAAFFWGGSTVMGRYVLRDIGFKTATALRFVFGFMFLFFIQIYLGRLGEVGAASGRDWLYVFMIAVLAGYLALLIYYKGLKVTKASVATIAELAFPFGAVAVNWIFLDAALSFVQIAGGLILLLAVTRLSQVNQEDLNQKGRKEPAADSSTA